MHQTSDLMRATRYSQLPMFKGYIPVDSISERRIFEPLIQGSTVDWLDQTVISMVIDESYPVVAA